MPTVHCSGSAKAELNAVGMMIHVPLRKAAAHVRLIAEGKEVAMQAN